MDYQGIVSSQIKSNNKALKYGRENNDLRLVIFEAKVQCQLGQLSRISSVSSPDQSILSTPLNNSRILFEVWHIDGHSGVARHATSGQVRRRRGGGSNVDRHEEGGGEAGGREDCEE